jgi:hypothetical protein
MFYYGLSALIFDLFLFLGLLPQALELWAFSPKKLPMLFLIAPHI